MQKPGFNSSIIFLLISFITSFNALGQDRINPRTLKEKCKSLTIRIYCNIKNDDKPVIWQRCYYDDCDSLLFDQKGNVLKSFGFDENWNIRKAEFEYDSLSNRISTKSYDSSGKLLNHTEFKYKFDDKGHIVEEISDESFFVPGDSFLNRMVNTGKSKYDENGNKTELCLIIANGKVTSTVAYKYNENNQLIEESSIISGTSIINTEYYEYDKHGNRTLWEHYNRGKLYSRNLSKYDDRNNLIEHVEYERRDGQLMFVFKSTIEYDESNNQTKVNTSNEKDELLLSVNYRYQYDQKENWTECALDDTRNIPVRKIVRKIEYY